MNVAEPISAKDKTVYKEDAKDILNIISGVKHLNIF